MNEQEILYRNTTAIADEESRSFSGLGIVFNSDSVPMYVWDNERGEPIKVVEQITAESLRDADMSDVIAAYNHNFEKIMGRTSAGTLSLTQTEAGIRYEFDTPSTTYGDDLLVSARRGDIRGSSFVFTMDWEAGYDISEREDGTLQAIPKKINRVYEMGPVTNPAYPETTAENRSAALTEAIQGFMQQKRDQEAEEQAPAMISDADMTDMELRLRLSEEEAAL